MSPPYLQAFTDVGLSFEARFLDGIVKSEVTCDNNFGGYGFG
jgi:hypothetical protein